MHASFSSNYERKPELLAPVIALQNELDNFSLIEMHHFNITQKYEWMIKLSEQRICGIGSSDNIRLPFTKEKGRNAGREKTGSTTLKPTLSLIYILGTLRVDVRYYTVTAITTW